MKFVPWQYISDWKCDLCGDCCKLYSVVIDFPEWLQIVKNFGVEKTAAGFRRQKTFQHFMKLYWVTS